jgi:hypothetical protein
MGMLNLTSNGSGGFESHANCSSCSVSIVRGKKSTIVGAIERATLNRENLPIHMFSAISELSKPNHSHVFANFQSFPRYKPEGKQTEIRYISGAKLAALLYIVSTKKKKKTDLFEEKLPIFRT